MGREDVSERTHLAGGMRVVADNIANDDCRSPIIEFDDVVPVSANVLGLSARFIQRGDLEAFDFGQVGWQQRVLQRCCELMVGFGVRGASKRRRDRGN